MTDYRQNLKLTPSRLLAGFGAATPTQKPEEWPKIREDKEAAHYPRSADFETGSFKETAIFRKRAQQVCQEVTRNFMIFSIRR
jgi:hypothetical protein